MAPASGEELDEVVLSVLGGRVVSDEPFEIVTDRPDMRELGPDFDPDYLVSLGDTTFVVELRRRLSIADVALAHLYLELIDEHRLLPRRVVYVLMAKVVPDNVKRMANRMDIWIFSLPHDLRLSSRSGSKDLSVRRLTHEKSWRVVAGLLRLGPTSVRRISQATGVSYGWTHATIDRLLGTGVATRDRAGVRVEDLERLLGGIAWERPLGELVTASVRVAGEDVMAAAREVQGALEGWGVRHAFAATTAGGLYTGYAQRFDRLYVYIAPEAEGSVLSSLEDPGGGVTLEVLRPDRDVFEGTEVRQGLAVVDASQALLDLAGLGYAAMDLTMEVARYLGETRGE